MALRRYLLALAILALPLAVSALTLEEIKNQLLQLLERVSTLKVQLEEKEKSAPPLPSDLPCLSLQRTLRFGVEGEDVRKLQEFLIGAGLLERGKATGYFGSLTEAAVQKWQTAAGIVSSGSPAQTGFGVVGPKTREMILSACKQKFVDTMAPTSRSCPVEPSPPTRTCARAWQKGLNAAGCVTGYVCWEDQISTSQEAATSPSIVVLEPTVGAMVTGGNTLTISWQNTGVGAGAVAIALFDSSGASVGEIARGLAPSGRYLWRVPKASAACGYGENAFDCIEKFALCDGSSSICSISPGTYRLRLTLGDLEAESSPFQISGTDIASALQDIVGAPALPPPSLTSSGEVGEAADVGTTSASAYVEIDVGTAYSTATPIVQSGYSSACPQEGWRAYLACPYGGCVTGWNVCRGGIWVLDSVQQTVIVGMQGPCANGEVWCGIGYGFGCVAANQCVNGNAL